MRTAPSSARTNLKKGFSRLLRSFMTKSLSEPRLTCIPSKTAAKRSDCLTNAPSLERESIAGHQQCGGKRPARTKFRDGCIKRWLINFQDFFEISVKLFGGIVLV